MMDDADALAAEIEAYRAEITERERQMFAALGVAPHIVATIGATNVDLDSSGTVWEPLEIGDRAYILPARIGDPFTPESAEPESVPEHGALVDLLAFHPAQPDEWATRCDFATWLGAIEPQYFNPDPVVVHRSPLAWLRAGMRGLCVLTRDPIERRALLLACRGGIVAEDHEHSRRLTQQIHLPLPLPRISVADRTRERAA